MSYVANQWEDGEKLDLEKYKNIEQGIVNIEAEKEALENKVWFIDENSTHVEYPSARAVWLRYMQILGKGVTYPIKWFDSDKETLLYANTGVYGSYPVYDNLAEPDVTANNFLKFDGSPIEIVSRAMDYRKKSLYERFLALYPELIPEEKSFPEVEYNNSIMTEGEISVAYYYPGLRGAYNFPNVTAIASSGFSRHDNLTNVSFPKCSIIKEYAFMSCNHLQTVYCPECTIIERGGLYPGFGDTNYNLQALYFPECSIISDNGCAHIGGYSLMMSFPKCTKIGAQGFASCRMSEINFPKCERIGGGAFEECYWLKFVNLPECLEIEDRAFYSCWDLSVVVLPKCSILGNDIFRSCSSLQSIYLFYSSVVTLNGSLRTDYRYPVYSIYVPESLVEAYKKDNNWKYYSNRIIACEF